LLKATSVCAISPFSVHGSPVRTSVPSMLNNTQWSTVRRFGLQAVHGCRQGPSKGPQSGSPQTCKNTPSSSRHVGHRLYELPVQCSPCPEEEIRGRLPDVRSFESEVLRVRCC
jgi:hypothetical protein